MYIYCNTSLAIQVFPVSHTWICPSHHPSVCPWLPSTVPSWPPMSYSFELDLFSRLTVLSDCTNNEHLIKHLCTYCSRLRIWKWHFCQQWLVEAKSHSQSMQMFHMYNLENIDHQPNYSFISSLWWRADASLLLQCVGFDSVSAWQVDRYGSWLFESWVLPLALHDTELGTTRRRIVEEHTTVMEHIAPCFSQGQRAVCAWQCSIYSNFLGCSWHVNAAQIVLCVWL